MRPVIIAVLLVFSAVTTSFSATYVIDEVVDAYTITVDTGETIHLNGIGLSESLLEEGQPSDQITVFAANAESLLKELLPKGHTIELKITGENDGIKEAELTTILDCNGENAASIMLHGRHMLHEKSHQNEVFVNAELVRLGLAMPDYFEINPEYHTLYSNLLMEARFNGRGIWHKDRPENQELAVQPSEKSEEKPVQVSVQEELPVQMPVAVKVAVKRKGELRGVVRKERGLNDEYLHMRIKDLETTLQARETRLNTQYTMIKQLNDNNEYVRKKLEDVIVQRVNHEREMSDLRVKLSETEMSIPRLVAQAKDVLEDRIVFLDEKLGEFKTKNREQLALIRDLEKDKKGIMHEKESLARKNNDLNTELARVKDQNKASRLAAKENVDLRKKLAGLQEKLEQTDSEVRSKDKEIEGLVSNREKLEGTIRKLLSKNETMENDLGILYAKLEKMKHEVYPGQGSAADGRQSYQDVARQFKASIKDNQERIQSQQGKIDELAKDKKELEKDLSQSAREKDRLLQELSDLREAMGRKEGVDPFEVADRMLAKNKEIAKMSDELKQTRDQIQEKQDIISGLLDERSLMQQQLDDSRSQYDALLSTTVENVKPKAQVNIAVAALGADGYEEGVRIKKDYYRSGALRSIEIHKEEKGEVIYKEYFENGVLFEESHFRNGRLDGLQRFYYIDGGLLIENNYIDGRLSGIKKMYTHDGQIWGQGYYKEGALLTKEEFDPSFKKLSMFTME